MNTTVKSLGIAFLKAVLAGVMIGIGGTVYLSCENKTVGAVLFAVGLFSVCVYKMNLYTGKIGYVRLSHFERDMRDMLCIWLGNLAGATLTGGLVRAIGRSSLTAAAELLAAQKVDADPFSVVVSAFFCGILMYVAVNTYRQFSSTHPIVGCLAVFLGVVTFILSGFEHCVANMFYVSAGAAWSWKTLPILLCATLGNSLGSTAIRQIQWLNAAEEAEN